MIDNVRLEDEAAQFRKPRRVGPRPASKTPSVIELQHRVAGLERQLQAARREIVGLQAGRDIAMRLLVHGRRAPAVAAPIAAADSAGQYLDDRARAARTER